jgi:tetratricopeptide (TPR) repeat protein
MPVSEERPPDGLPRHSVKAISRRYAIARANPFQKHCSRSKGRVFEYLCLVIVIYFAIATGLNAESNSSPTALPTTQPSDNGVDVDVYVPAPKSTCDELAASSDDYDKPTEVTAVDDSVLDSHVDAAIDACKLAVGQFPNERRFMFQLARSLGEKKQFPEAAAWLQKAVDLNDRAAMNYLGVLYRNGWGVKEDSGKARDLYEKAATLGDAWAMDNLGVLYEQSADRSMWDEAKARDWYKKGAERGYQRSMWHLGHLYEYGRGGDKDLRMAQTWFEKAAIDCDKSQPTCDPEVQKWSRAELSQVSALMQAEAEKPCRGQPIPFGNSASESTGWDMTEGVGLQSGVLSFTVAPDNAKIELNSAYVVRDAQICSKFEWPHDADQVLGAGILFWAVDDKDFFQFGILNNGKFWVARKQAGKWQTIAANVESADIDIRPGASNTFAVHTQGDHALLFVNGTQVFNLTGQPQIAASRFGLSVDNFDKNQTLVLGFDDFKVNSTMLIADDTEYLHCSYHQTCFAVIAPALTKDCGQSDETEDYSIDRAMGTVELGTEEHLPLTISPSQYRFDFTEGNTKVSVEINRISSKFVHFTHYEDNGSTIDWSGTGTCEKLNPTPKF